jgi:uncharacterized protein (DUF4415 family)
MSNDRPRRPVDPWKSAQALFNPAAPKAAAPTEARPKIPAARETVSLRIDRDVLEHFQESGPGWQDRINTALRQAAGIKAAGSGGDEGLTPDQLNSSNDG